MTQFDLNQSTTKPKIAFLGIGLMGQPMTSRLLQAGYAVTVWNRTRSKADELAPLGAIVEEQVADAVRNADIVITMLEAGPIVAQVIAAALPGLRTGALLIDMSSTRQSEAQDAHARLAQHGVRFIDAPVSGGVVGAQAGSLAIMAGGNAEDFAEAEAVLTVMGRPTLVGPAGCGQIAKLCNQLIVGGTLNIVAEALLLAQAGGADPTAVRAAIRGGFAESRILEVHGQRMLERNFMPGGQVKSQFKDLENVLIAAANAGLRLPVTELVTENYQRVLQQSPQADQSAVLLALEQSNPGQRLGKIKDQLPG
ncbi:NAD(P)-dependent oxidoreductase [Herminiimonas fonticola]|uniref:2-hydroxy-3-oxopropionate reductase n=1 Tax=Herminiimonas fonticola TaxID=303380 RepID=A0A4R6G351_9BURK|nr:NAD(P)-dependent oxidoreductase [Herminiimonas fonticola]RBA23120.1 3-hydroxyisobutyrate dehydrogenase and related beta-hydroxyacid dehydrogenase [Herminiimonas fonticola]TDN88839.1 2-hydroxy-3-oxopropionate reductase [Herminiimonas fonticola]